MAKRAKVSKSGGTTIVTVPAAAPVARRRRSSGIRRSGGGRRRRGGGRRRSSVGGGGGPNRMIGHAVGGFAVGFIEKTFPNLPTLPIVGKKGAIAIAAYLLRGRHPIVSDIGMAAAAISGYELGKLGNISGDVMGVAAQI